MTPNLEIVNSEFKGATKVTCKEATRLLNEDKIRKAWFRPNGLLTKDADNDDAYVWGLHEND